LKVSPHQACGYAESRWGDGLAVFLRQLAKCSASGKLGKKNQRSDILTYFTFLGKTSIKRMSQSRFQKLRMSQTKKFLFYKVIGPNKSHVSAYTPLGRKL
jgi:hypothetical protein